MNSCRNCFWSTAWFFGTPPGVAVAVTFWRSVLETPPRLIDILRSRSCAEAQSTARGGRQCGRGCSGGNGARRPARAGLVRRGLGLRRTPVGVAELVLADADGRPLARPPRGGVVGPAERVGLPPSPRRVGPAGRLGGRRGGGRARGGGAGRGAGGGGGARGGGGPGGRGGRTGGEGSDGSF